MEDVAEGQKQGGEADGGIENKCQEEGDEAEGEGRQEGAEVEVTQILAAREQVVEQSTLAGWAGAQGEQSGGALVECEVKTGLQVEGGAVCEIALGVAGGSAKDAAGAHGRDAEGEGVEVRVQGGAGDEPGRSGEQAEGTGEREQGDGEKKQEGDGG
ncbi:MAG: hypothetical protein SOZ01_01515 [Selenomonadaceae bacterium]|nr:hypothetical protein [Selenomonadaceae bacterium]MDD7057395.1 hypothetical protein [Selenomonadaceae bacterium]MDY3915412.1 hypothetical protein [Selenomonadaceae bacterium]